MVKQCLFLQCRNKQLKREDAFHHVQFHSFPMGKPEVLEKWVEAVGRSANWKPGPSSRLCSDHFSPDCYRAGSRRLLHPDAVPSTPEALSSTRAHRPNPPRVGRVEVRSRVDTVRMEYKERLARLRRNNRVLQLRLRRRDARLGQLRKRLAQARKGDQPQVQTGAPAGLIKELVEHSVRYAGYTKPTGVRYSQPLKEFALGLYLHSPRAYHYVRSLLHLLPNPSLVKKWLSRLHADSDRSVLVDDIHSFIVIEDQDVQSEEVVLPTNSNEKANSALNSQEVRVELGKNIRVVDLNEIRNGMQEIQVDMEEIRSETHGNLRDVRANRRGNLRRKVVKQSSGQETSIGNLRVVNLNNLRNGIQEIQVDMEEIRSDVHENLREMQSNVPGRLRNVRAEARGNLRKVRAGMLGNLPLDVQEMQSDIHRNLPHDMREIQIDMHGHLTENMRELQSGLHDHLQTGVREIRSDADRNLHDIGEIQLHVREIRPDVHRNLRTDIREIQVNNHLHSDMRGIQVVMHENLPADIQPDIREIQVDMHGNIQVGIQPDMQEIQMDMQEIQVDMEEMQVEIETTRELPLRRISPLIITNHT